MIQETRSYERTRTRDLEQPQYFDDEKINTLEFCEHCVLGKHKVNFSTGKHKTEGVLDYIYLDLWVTSKLPLKGGKRYLLTFIVIFQERFDFIS